MSKAPRKRATDDTKATRSKATNTAETTADEESESLDALLGSETSTNAESAPKVSVGEELGRYDYDLIVMGSGPSGQRAAIAAAKLEKRVAIIEQRSVIGGVCVNTGTIPSKTLREAVMRLSGFRDREVYGASYTVKERITMDDLMFRVNHVIRHEIDTMRHHMMRNDVDVISAQASFVDSHTVRVNFSGQHGFRDIRAPRILIAVGTETTKDEHIPFDGDRIMTSDDIVDMKELPKTLAVAGAGVIGLEYASILAPLGVRVTVIDKRTELLSFVDSEVIDTLVYEMRQQRATFWLGEEVSRIEPYEDDAHGPRVRLHLASGKQVTADKALYSIGRTGATANLNLEAAGLSADSRGRLKVNEFYQTDVPHIYAAGDVVGFPSLASTSMEQGRVAANHAFGVEVTTMPSLFPYGIYAIPEIAMVGKTEQELTEAGVPFEVGKAHYREIARGQILGDSTGFLKLIFHLETLELLGVHIIGEGASELIHIGQTVLTFGGSVEYFVNTVFNYPTLAECYKVAALDGMNRVGG
ncbi:MAG: Si-specific NAD(P)(+) transhydrogenase [Candidatus Poribacteria bacterium]|nr:Si-specific NAD(P)(+) transhydrogenase [Candidatus Poribacteria bacterium]